MISFKFAQRLLAFELKTIPTKIKESKKSVEREIHRALVSRGFVALAVDGWDNHQTVMVCVYDKGYNVLYAITATKELPQLAHCTSARLFLGVE